MKKIVLLAMLVSVTASAREAYIQLPWDTEVGAVVEVKYGEILYTKEKCTLPLVHAKTMRRYEYLGGAEHDIGCWANTLSGRALIVTSDGETSDSTVPTLFLVDIRPDNSAKVLAKPTLKRY
ncbi:MULTISPECIES: hypothetical protein [Burkholderia]|uniref:hypothetical protein n=1 Tax=Burkholderia TaxID=32008 RepID=UPI000DC4B503|nr:MULTISPECIES: hypothetical protein [Burkholderia]MDP9544212.1 hypothetical protein [Burkholderia cepacia]MBR8471929.1 hypothetical protein [Burkholderia cenocepacia]MDP9594203.1 hypothetical protein [Burkholderia cepacia]MDP9621801.1 hypothetical protein [Burkholderia cepacia]MDP9667865.1 hypothetical protein [Burkholderia cepacia]